MTDTPRKGSGAAKLTKLAGGRQRLPDITGTNLEHTRIFNRRLIFEALHQSGPLSRIDIAKRVGLTPQTVSGITRELLDQQFIIETGRSQGQRGQPQIYLGPNPIAGFSIGIHLDRNRVVMVVCNLLLEVIGRKIWAGDTRNPDSTLKHIARLTDDLIAEAAVPRDKIWSIGLVLPTLDEDIYDFATKQPGWDAWANVPVAQRLKDLCGLTVLVENDATAAAIGEHFARSDRDKRNFAHLYIGYGVGAGVIIDGMPLKGVWGNAGELGLLPFQPKRIRDNGEPPIIDSVLSLSGIAAALEWSIEEADAAVADLSILADLHSQRDPRLSSWMEEAGLCLRFLTAILESTTDPEFITVGGSLPPSIIAALVERAYPLHRSLSERKDRLWPRLLVGQLTDDAPVIGAASLPIFVTTNPNFRHLYIRQLGDEQRPFEQQTRG
ncbi:ROK family transcriptional regulator [Rhizobium sp. P44RR-XXIV]|uniref:ROK family transcriptional regulator n=1 Tax=Rhizobium sp. P44RR-XXIV TaxID=1921145 RepID=UPI000984FE66|nr:ROK family transcriptional regulator [Rhizobium sp. P44RR-XXIV]TIX87361.1 ROK family transcriptional regulator [Rhizobium sp. P44RR-XXIV]